MMRRPRLLGTTLAAETLVAVARWEELLAKRLVERCRVGPHSWCYY
jgi:hypothetical protein